MVLEGDQAQWVCLRPAGSVWVLGFLQKRFHSMKPGDSESMFIKAGESETKEGLRVEETTGYSLGSALLVSLETL